MTDDPQPDLPSLSDDQQRILQQAQRSFMMRQTMAELLRALPSPREGNCLICTPDNGVFSYHLNRRGSTWHTLLLNPEAVTEARVLAGDKVHLYDGQALPFEDAHFQVVVIIGTLERVEDDHNFIMQCHRVLAPDGRLILNALNDKAFSLVRPFRRMLGLTPQALNLYRSGYSEKELFELLKDGFDVHSMYTYSRFSVQMLNALVQASITKSHLHGSFPTYHNRLYSLFCLAYYFDFLIFFLPGYRVVASAKRRAWRPRKTPILNDGRTLTEAVLSPIQN